MHRQTSLFSLVAGALAAACIAAGIPAHPQDNADTTADLILHNGAIVTIDDDLGTVQALAVKGDRILAVGSDEQIMAMAGAETKVIDLDGRLAVPGFIEGHAHFTGVGEAKMNLDLMTVKNWGEVIAMVAEAVKNAEPGEWITGRGWHQEKWDKVPEGAIEGFPTHHDLSAVSPDNPVHLTHASGHASFANQKAMDLAGVSGSTPNPPGGEILHDENGAPTGVFRETASGLISRAQSTGGEGGGRGGVMRQRAERLDRAIKLASDECLANGITSFQDAGSSFMEIDRFAQFAESGELGVRLWVMIRQPNDVIRSNIDRYNDIRGIGENHLTVGGIKLSIDGALGSRGAWLLEPYSDSPESTGLATATTEQVKTAADLALANNLQLCVHAIGDRANREVLDIYEDKFAANPDKQDLRWRIEHAQHLHPDDIPRFAGLGVVASMQGVHCTSDGPWVYVRLGDERAANGAYMWRELIDSGAVVTNGTDAPVERIDPIASFDASVTRRMKDGKQFFPGQCMTRMEALKSYTINAAYAAFEEDIKGTLTPGKLADIVVLSRNILEVPDDQIAGTQVLKTIVGGEVLYEAEPRAEG